MTGEPGVGGPASGIESAATLAGEEIPLMQRRFERLLASSRLLILLPVVMLLLIAAGSFVYGTIIFFASIAGNIHDPARVGGKLSHFLIVEDLFLVGATLMISAFGFYGLFVIRAERRDSQYWLPKWLQMRDLEDLKARIVSMLILVAAITFVDVVVEFHGDQGVFYLGIGVALVIVALTVFLRLGRQDHAPAIAAGAPAEAARAVAARVGDKPRPAERSWPVVPHAADAPGLAARETAARERAGPVAEPGPRHGRIVALLGAARRDGAWNVAPVTRVMAVAGGARLDLRDAALPGGQIRIKAVAALGGVSVTIPPEMRVADSGLTILGGRSISGDSTQSTRPDAPLLVISGLCVLGLVRVRHLPRQDLPKST